MTLDIQSMEALAHYTRGGVTIFFVFSCFLLRKYEKRSYMLKLLYFSSLLIAVPQFGLSSHAFRDIAFRVIGHSSFPKAVDSL